MDLADSAEHGDVAVAVADVSLRAGDVSGQPLAVLHGDELVCRWPCQTLTGSRMSPRSNPQFARNAAPSSHQP